MTGLNGKWAYVSSDNLDALINATVAAERRDKAKNNATNHSMELQSDGATFTYNTTTPEANNTMTFSPGKEFDYIMASGKKVKAIWTNVSDSKANIDLSDGSLKAQVVAEVSGTELTMTTTLGSVTNVTKYKKA